MKIIFDLATISPSIPPSPHRQPQKTRRKYARMQVLTGVLSPRTTYHSHLEARSICQDFLELVVTLGNPLLLHAYEYNESNDRQIQLPTCCTPREVIGSLNQPKAVFGLGDHPDDSHLVSLRLALTRFPQCTVYSTLPAVCAARDRHRLRINFPLSASKRSIHLNLSKKKRLHGTTRSISTPCG